MSLSLLVGGCTSSGTGSISAASFGAALNHSDRPDDDRTADARRHPAKVLTFAGLKRDDVVLDFVAGDGYYTEVISRALGASGRVYSHRLAKERGAADRLPNVTVVADDEPEGSGLVDLIVTARNYHDLVNLDIERGPVLEHFRGLLKPGGRLLVIDHSAHAGSGTAAAGKLHRIDEQMVRDEIVAAGFELVGSSNLLRNPEDKRNERIFDASVVGRTDRFVLLFVRSEAGSGSTDG